MKSSSFDFGHRGVKFPKNKNLDIDLDALGSKLDLLLHKTVYWQNSRVILEKSYLSHISSFSTAIW